MKTERTYDYHKDKPAVAMNISKHLTSFLGTKVSFNDVLDAMLMLEMGMKMEGNEPLQKHVETTLKGMGVTFSQKVK